MLRRRVCFQRTSTNSATQSVSWSEGSRRCILTTALPYERLWLFSYRRSPLLDPFVASPSELDLVTMWSVPPVVLVHPVVVVARPRDVPLGLNCEGNHLPPAPQPNPVVMVVRPREVPFDVDDEGNHLSACSSQEGRARQHLSSALYLSSSMHPAHMMDVVFLCAVAISKCPGGRRDYPWMALMNSGRDPSVWLTGDVMRQALADATDACQ